LQLLTNLKKLRIIVFNGLIEDLSDLSYIDDLEEFRIYDNVKKGISLEPLAKFKNLTTLGLYTGFTTKQYSIINTFDKLQCLDAFDIDLSKIVDLPIKKLFVGRKILGSELILKKIPSIESIFLEKCKEVNISSISQLERLNSVHLRYMNHISVIPFFKNEEYIYDFECVGLSKLENIEAVFRMKKLRALMLTNLELLKAEDFSRLSELPNLKIAYITFKDPKENLKFFEFCQRNNWIYKQPALVK
uniref:mitochondrial large ribosomal subunit protein uL15m n=2 Tax=Treponema pedis TaxID=409322 RepID=UPI0004947EF8